MNFNTAKLMGNGIEIWLSGPTAVKIQHLEEMTCKSADEIANALMEPALNQIFPDDHSGCDEGLLQLCFEGFYETRSDAEMAAHNYNAFGLINQLWDFATAIPSTNASESIVVFQPGAL